jgi:hypothetical protein
MRSTAIRLAPGLLLALIACSGPAPFGDDADDDPNDPDANPGDDGDGGGGDNDGGVAPDANAAPAVLDVCATGGATYTTIGDAIAAADPGDTIEVCAGTYNERLVIEKQLFVRGLGGLESTIIDAQGGGTAIRVDGTPGGGVLIEGFTIRNGVAPMGAGIFCNASNLLMRNSAILASTATDGGGGLYATGCTIDIETVRFEGNEGGLMGGGALLASCAGSLRESQFISNGARYGAGLGVTEGTVTIESNTLRLNSARTRGGGIYHSSDSTLSMNAILENYAGWTGGGLHIDLHAPLIVGNTVSQNRSVNDGGGIYVHQGMPTIRGNTFTFNIGGDDGGGVRLFESACVLEGNTIENNSTDDGGGGVRISHIPCMVIDNIIRNNYAGGTGGGLDLDNDSSTVRGGEITDNEAGGSGGGVFAWLGPWNGHVFEDVLIARNNAWRGGGMMLDDNFEPVTIRRVRFVGNDAGHGGGLMVRRTNLTLTDSLFVDNEANFGGGLKHQIRGSWPVCEPDPGEECPPEPPLNPTVLVDFVVFHGNEADEGAGVWSNEVGLTVRNSIVTGSIGGPAVAVGEKPPEPVEPPEMPPPMGTFPPITWRYNDVFPASFLNMADPTGSNGNLSSDPLFVDVVAGDFHLTPGSVCINAGDPQMLDDDGSRADMGLAGGAP